MSDFENLNEESIRSEEPTERDGSLTDQDLDQAAGGAESAGDCVTVEDGKVVIHTSYKSATPV